MNIFNNTPFISDYMLSAHIDSGFMLTVIVKGTFEICDNQTVAITQNQIPIPISDEYNNTDQEPCSIRIESDFVTFKPRTDIILIGRAYASHQIPVRTLTVTLKVGKIQKSIAVFGDRGWHYDSRSNSIIMTNPAPFKTMELTYERAFGGRDEKSGEVYEANPVGRGFIANKAKELFHKKFLPNLEDPTHLIASWKDQPPKPAGFGFIGKSWQPRRQYVGTYDREWEMRGGLEMPQDFRFDFYNGAHPDLQVPGYLRGNELVEMKNLTPEGYFSFKLPGLRPVITVHRQIGFDNPENDTETAVIENTGEDSPTIEDEKEPVIRQETVEEHLDTIVFMPDERKFFQVWRGLCSLKDFDVSEIKKIEIQLEQFENKTKNDANIDFKS